MTTSGFKKCVLAAALAFAGTTAVAVPAMAQVYWGPGPYYGGYYRSYGGAPGATWNPHPPAGYASHSRATRHRNCPVGTGGCY